MPSQPAVGLSGELYLRSTRPFLADHVTHAEAKLLWRHFRDLRVDGPLLDVGCGHGRHLERVVALARPRPVVGIDLDALSLSEIERPAALVRGDLFRLPFAEAAFAGAWSWYNTLFTHPDEDSARAFVELRRVVKPDGLLIVQGQPLGRIEQLPDVDSDQTLPDGSRLQEKCVFNRALKRDEALRTLTTPDGRVLQARFFIRYYSPEELTGVIERAGWKVEWAVGSVDGTAMGPESTDLIIGARRLSS